MCGILGRVRQRGGSRELTIDKRLTRIHTWPTYNHCYVQHNIQFMLATYTTTYNIMKHCMATVAYDYC